MSETSKLKLRFWQANRRRLGVIHAPELASCQNNFEITSISLAFGFDFFDFFCMTLARNPLTAKTKPNPQRTSPKILACKGWSAQAAARYLGCTTGHLIRVINGERPQGRLMPLVAALPNLLEQKEGQP